MGKCFRHGLLDARAFLAEKALQYYDSLASEARGDEKLQWELAQGYERVGELQGGNLRSNISELAPMLGPGLGKTADALATLRKALDIEERLLAKHPGNREYRIHLATLYFNIGTLEPDASQAIDLMRKAISVAREINPPPARAPRLLLGLGDAQLRAGDPREAVATFRQVRSPEARKGEALRGEAFALAAMGDLEQALRAFGQVFSEEGGLQTLKEGSVAYRFVARYYVMNYWRSASILGSPRDLNLGRLDEALEHSRRAVTLAEKLARFDPNDVPVKQLLSDAYLTKASLLQDRDPVKALESARKAAEAAPSAAAHAEIAYSLRKLGKRDEALAELKRALDLGSSSPETAIFIHHQQGDLLGDPAHYRQALAIAEKAVAEKPSMMPLRKALADCYEKLGQFDRSLEIWKSWNKWGVSSAYNERREHEAEAALRKTRHP